MRAAREHATIRLIAALVVVAPIAALVALAAARIAVWWHGGFLPLGGGATASNPFEYNLKQYLAIDPSLIRYRQTAEIDVPMRLVRAVAVGPDDRIHVAGDRAIDVFALDGAKVTRLDLDAMPTCLAVDERHVYVGMRDHVQRWTLDGKERVAWPALGPRAVLASIGLDEENVFAADAGNKVVWRFDREGKPTGRLDRRDPEHGEAGFVIPSPYFDVAVGADGLVRVVDPGRHRVEAFTSEGRLETPLGWGTPSFAIEGFCGCCNPVNIALLPDGRVVTAEKGIPRVKVHSAEGTFECVVAGPAELVPAGGLADETRPEFKLLAVDVAADSRGRVLVLDPARRSVRVFEEVK
ncbi:MAG: NHL repeat-containing protein [Pirellulales bacterium]|nr:NHL repeat-containing protein [Pirellulales bacterium]